MSLKVQALPRHHLRAEAMLFGVVVLWATTNPAQRWLVGEGELGLPISAVLAVRFALAAALVVVWRPSTLRFRGHGHEWAVALWMGALMGVAFATQSTGLRTIGATRSHFITNLSVVMVPLLQTVYLRARPSNGTLAGVACAFVGLVLLTQPLGGGVVVGDLWTLGCAVATSVYIIELQRLAPRLPLSRLLFGQFAPLAVVCAIVAVVSGGASSVFTPSVWGLLVYLGVICTFGLTLLHNRFQRETTPTRTALIFATGPVLTFAVAWVTLGETLDAWQVLGAALILLGIVVAEVLWPPARGA